MVEETIKTIKETENEADEIIRKADATCTEILEKAAREAKEIKEQRRKQSCPDSKCKETGRSRSFAGERRRRSLKETGFREDGTGDRSIKSTGSGKRRGGGIRSHQSIALMIWEE